MTALAKSATGTALGRQHETGYFTREQIDTLKNVICPGLTDPELHLVSEVAKQTGLSPFVKQLHVTKRPTWDPDTKTRVPKLTIQTGIDGYRLIAERTGKYLGQRPPEWCGPDGVWRDIWLSMQPPAAARVVVLKAGCEPFVGLARYDAYVQTKQGGEPNSMWAKMGPEQLAKCAEALAFRKAFPQELSPVYTEEEMGQADNPEPVRAEVIEPPPRVQQQPPAPPARALPTKTTAKYPEKQYADVPFSSLPHSALTAYVAYYRGKLSPDLQANHRQAIEATIAAAEAEVERRIAEEAASAAADPGDESEPEAPADVVDFDPETGEVREPSDLERQLQASVDAEDARAAAAVELAQQGIEWGNTNAALGLEGADAPANQTGTKRSRRSAG